MSETENNVQALSYDVLRSAVESAAAFRCRRRLQPAGGTGDKIFPPTYAGENGPDYAKEQRRLPGYKETVTCILLDSVQSQANRMEEALQDAVDDGRFTMPLVAVDFSEADLIDPIGKITSLQTPHRIADAILRDSRYENKPFRESNVGESLNRANLAFATPLFRLCPQALVFGMWDSTGPKGGLGAKFERAIVSEMIAVNADIGVRSSSRVDPIVKRTEGITVYEHKTDLYTLDPKQAKQEKGKAVLYKKKGKVSETNLGNVTPSLIDDKTKRPQLGGVTADYAEQMTTLSMIALRRLRFPIDEKKPATTAVNNAAQAVLAALGLAAATLAFGPGMDLRSRCVLFPEGPMSWDLLAVPGSTPTQYSLDSTSAVELLHDAVAAAKKAGLPWETKPIVLTPSAKLVALVRESQQLGAKDDSEADTTVDPK